MRPIEHPLMAVIVMLLFVSASTVPACAQTPSPAATPPVTTTSPPAAPALAAKDIQGLDVFGSDGQQVGKIAKVTEAAGAVKDVEVHSGGFLGFFSKTYVVPADKLLKKGGRVELSMTSDQAKQFIK